MVDNATFQQVDGGKTQLTATIPAAEVDAAIATVYRDASKKYKFPGFRPGKAPRSMVENLIGDEYARALATDKVVNDTFARIVDGAGYRVVGQPEFDDEILVKEGEDFTYVVTFETRPALALSDTAVTITMPPREATDKEVTAQIDAIRERFAQLKKVDDRQIKPDDVVVLSFTSTVDGQPYEGSTVDHYAYRLGQNMMPPQFEEAIVGAVPGDSVTAEFIIEASEEDTEFSGKPIAFAIELHEIQEPVLPEVNDDLAAMSGFESADEMIAEMRSTIESSKQNSYDNVARSRLVAALAQNLEGEVPDELVQARADFLKRDFEAMLGRNNINMEQYLAMSGSSVEAYTEEVQTQARLGVAEELALEALAREQGFEATEADVTAELQKLADEGGVDLATARQRWEKAALMTPLRDDIVRRKAADWLVENATIEIDEEAF